MFIAKKNNNSNADFNNNYDKENCGVDIYLHNNNFSKKTPLLQCELLDLVFITLLKTKKAAMRRLFCNRKK